MSSRHSYDPYDLETAWLLGRSPFHAPITATKQTGLTGLCGTELCVGDLTDRTLQTAKGNCVAEDMHDEGHLV